MLEPETRELLLDLLRPPDGWQVDLAVGTTFTLDLQALLVAPLSFAMFDWALDDHGRIDPLAALEALRRHAAHTTVFCQAGMISLPGRYQPLLVHLENCVVPITPTASEAIFHPKVWLLRFTNEGQEPRYRLLNLSRNLTFDTSWDTVVALEGARRMKRTPSAPVGRFLHELAERGHVHLGDNRIEELHELADEVAHIKFSPPEGFDTVRFHPQGLGAESRASPWPFPADHDRALVVSPFLGPSTLARMKSAEGEDVVVSRPESLDAHGARSLAGWDTRVLASDQLEEDTLVASDAVDDGHAHETTRPAARETETDEHLRGLHAKVFLFDRGERSHLFTGSANATSAAFGANVEFLLELVGDRDEIGIDRMLDTESKTTTFGHLVKGYPVSEEPEQEDEAARSLTADLERAQRMIGRLTYTAQANRDDDLYVLSLEGSGDVQLPDSITQVACWRITAGQGHLITPEIASDGLRVAFGRVPEDGLTSFYAFEVTGAIDHHKDLVRFVVNARLEGGPEDRAERVLARLLRNRSDLMRYLQFLLADTGAGLLDLLDGFGEVAGDSAHRPSFLEQPALMERLLRTLARDPYRLVHVDRLLQDLKAAGRIEELAPAGLQELWAAIDVVRHEVVGGAEEAP